MWLNKQWVLMINWLSHRPECNMANIIPVYHISVLISLAYRRQPFLLNSRKFWHTVKPFLSDKTKSEETIILVNNDNVGSKETEVAKTFNYFFSNIVKNLEIPENKCEDDLRNQLSGSPVLQAIMKYRKYPSINTVRRFLQRNSRFYFSPVDKKLHLMNLNAWELVKLCKTKISPSKFSEKMQTFLLKK